MELAIGILASLTANINRDSKRRPDPFTPKDFMVDWAARLEKEEAPEDEDGMDPVRIMAVMEEAMRAQERRLKNGG